MMVEITTIRGLRALRCMSFPSTNGSSAAAEAGFGGKRSKPIHVQTIIAI
jgi:hypothetical protein